MAAAIGLSMRGRGRTAPNPNVGCIIVRDGVIIGRGWTQPGGRPHAEARALDGVEATGADIYVTLEPCAHASERGPACAELLVAAAPARVIVALRDPDPRTNGKGIEQLKTAGIAVEQDMMADAARRAMAGFLMRQTNRRPHITLKLATSLDGQIAMADGESQWITGEESRAHAHVERALADIVIVGRKTAVADTPRLDVRLGGLAERTPKRGVLTRDYGGFAKIQLHADRPGWEHVASPESVADITDVDSALIEGGASAAAAFLAADYIDRLVLYRAPILIGSGVAALGDIGLQNLSDAHGRWVLTEHRMLGKDRLEVYERDPSTSAV